MFWSFVVKPKRYILTLVIFNWLKSQNNCERMYESSRTETILSLATEKTICSWMSPWGDIYFVSFSFSSLQSNKKSVVLCFTTLDDNSLYNKLNRISFPWEFPPFQLPLELLEWCCFTMRAMRWLFSLTFFYILFSVGWYGMVLLLVVKSPLGYGISVWNFCRL